MLNNSNALETLNGWRRAWVLCSIIWLVVVVVSSFGTFPIESEKIAAMNKLDFELFPPLKFDPGSCLDKGINDQARKCYEVMRTIRDNEIESRMEREKSTSKYVEEHIIYDQASFLGKRVMFWLLPTVGLYVIGLMVSWVIRGFKNDRR